MSLSRRNPRLPPRSVTCDTCGDVFVIKGSKLKTRYCSRKCMAGGYSIRMKGSSNPNFSDALRHKRCRHCGGQIANYNRQRRYCSFGCYVLEGEALGHRGCRKDLNHNEIVAAFKKLNCRVLDLHQQGGGMPDLFVGAHGVWHPVEIKNLKHSYGRKGLSRLQKKVDEEMGGFEIVTSIDDAIHLFDTWRAAADAYTRGILPSIPIVRTMEEGLQAVGADRRS